MGKRSKKVKASSAQAHTAQHHHYLAEFPLLLGARNKANKGNSYRLPDDLDPLAKEIGKAFVRLATHESTTLTMLLTTTAMLRRHGWNYKSTRV